MPMRTSSFGGRGDTLALLSRGRAPAPRRRALSAPAPYSGERGRAYRSAGRSGSARARTGGPAPPAGPA